MLLLYDFAAIISTTYLLLLANYLKNYLKCLSATFNYFNWYLYVR